jgi:putative flippase GtrA
VATRQAPSVARAPGESPPEDASALGREGRLDRRTLLRLPDPRSAGGEDWAQLVRYCVVGCSGYLLNLAVFTGMITLLGGHYASSAVIAFIVAWTSNFFLNKYWTFRRHERSAVAQGWRNLLVSLGTLTGNILLLQMFLWIGLPAVPAQAIAVVLVMPPNFLLNRRWSFR